MQVDQVGDTELKAVKRKASKAEDDANSENEQDDVEMLDVDFEFFDPQPPDYHSIKLLLSQLLSHDAARLDLGGIADLILEQKLVGSTVKTDGAESDPYAILTVLNLNVHKENASIKSLIAYLLPKLSASPALHSALTTLLDSPADASTPGKPSHVGLVVSERLVNMPPQVVPPMYNMLSEELEWARDAKEPYHFSHLLFLSRVFLSSAEDLDEDPNASLNPETIAPSKSKKKKKKPKTAETAAAQESKGEQVWMYHAEDDFIARVASHTHVFPYSSAPEKREGDAFGVETRGQVMLVEWTKFGEIVGGLEGFLGSVG